jgi:hypothetical protein
VFRENLRLNLAMAGLARDLWCLLVETSLTFWR